MSKHTPGPWLAEYRNAAYFDVYAFNDGRRGRVAEVTSHGGKDVPTMRANARLIAAAPDLLAALQNIAVFKHAALYAMASRPETEASMRSVFEQIDDAIAKAEGRNPKGNV